MGMTTVMRHAREDGHQTQQSVMPVKTGIQCKKFFPVIYWIPIVMGMTTVIRHARASLSS